MSNLSSISPILPPENTVPPNKLISETNNSCQIYTYPFKVTLIGRRLCGGSLLTLSWILTAAHCIKLKDYPQNPYEITARAGFNIHLQSRYLNRALVHEKFDPCLIETTVPELRYDIAVVLTNEPFQPSLYVAPGTLPQLGYTGKCEKGRVVMNAGKSPPTEIVNGPLQCVDTTIVNGDSCARDSYVVDDTIICGVEKDVGVCEGASGGPLVCGDIVVGIISMGPPCGVKNEFATYTKVESYLVFINESMESGGINRKMVAGAISSTPISLLLLLL